MMDDKGNFSTAGDRIKQLRKGLGINQTKFCSATSISRRFISNLETNKAELTEQVAEKISSVYNVSEEFLLTGDETTKDYPVTDALLAFLRHSPSARKLISDMMENAATASDSSANP